MSGNEEVDLLLNLGNPSSVDEREPESNQPVLRRSNRRSRRKDPLDSDTEDEVPKKHSKKSRTVSVDASGSMRDAQKEIRALKKNVNDLTNDLALATTTIEERDTEIEELQAEKKSVLKEVERIQDASFWDGDRVSYQRS